MKKAYSKPQIMFEDFTLTTNIAAGCEEMGTNQSLNSCGMDYSGLIVFMESMSGCTGIKVKPKEGFGGDGDFAGICYQVPGGYNVFNS